MNTKIKTSSGVWTVEHNAENRPVKFTYDLTKNICELLNDGATIAFAYDYTPFGALTTAQSATDPGSFFTQMYTRYFGSPNYIMSKVLDSLDHFSIGGNWEQLYKVKKCIKTVVEKTVQMIMVSLLVILTGCDAWDADAYAQVEKTCRQYGIAGLDSSYDFMSRCVRKSDNTLEECWIKSNRADRPKVRYYLPSDTIIGICHTYYTNRRLMWWDVDMERNDWETAYIEYYISNNVLDKIEIYIITSELDKIDTVEKLVEKLKEMSFDVPDIVYKRLASCKQVNIRHQLYCQHTYTKENHLKNELFQTSIKYNVTQALPYDIFRGEPFYLEKERDTQLIAVMQQKIAQMKPMKLDSTGNCYFTINGKKWKLFWISNDCEGKGVFIDLVSPSGQKWYTNIPSINGHLFFFPDENTIIVQNDADKAELYAIRLTAETLDSNINHAQIDHENDLKNEGAI